MFALLLDHGDVVFGVLLVLGGFSGWASLAYWRYRTARARWRRRTGRRFPRSSLELDGDGAVALRGRVRGRGEGAAAQTIAAMAAVSEDVIARTTRPEWLVAVLDDGRELELVGRVEVVGLASRRIPPGKGEGLRAAAGRGLAPTESWPFEDLPLEVRELHDGDEVVVFGRLGRAVDEGRSYREGASRSVVRAAEDGAPIVLSRRRRPSAWLGAVVGIVGMLVALAALGGPTVEAHGYLLPRHASLVVPWQRPIALRAHRAYLRRRMRLGPATPAEAERALALTPPLDGETRIQALLISGRRAEAVAEATRGCDEPLERALRLEAMGLRSEALEVLRSIEGTEARALEVQMRAGEHEYWPARPDRLARALAQTCGEDWTCAAHPRLLWNHAPHWRFDVHAVLLGDARHRSIERGEIMLRVAGDSTFGDRRIARSRVRWLLDLGAQQLRLGAVDVALHTVERARRTLCRWPGTALDLARDVDHLEAAAYLFERRGEEIRSHSEEVCSHDESGSPGCPIDSFRNLVPGSPPKLGGHLPFRIVGALAEIGRWPNNNHRFTHFGSLDVHDLSVLQWIAPFLSSAARDRLVRSFDAQASPGATPRATALARVLRALRLGAEAERVERTVTLNRVAEHGW